MPSCLWDIVKKLWESGSLGAGDLCKGVCQDLSLPARGVSRGSVAVLGSHKGQGLPPATMSSGMRSASRPSEDTRSKSSLFGLSRAMARVCPAVAETDHVPTAEVQDSASPSSRARWDSTGFGRQTGGTPSTMGPKADPCWAFPASLPPPWPPQASLTNKNKQLGPAGKIWLCFDRACPEPYVNLKWNTKNLLLMFLKNSHPLLPPLVRFRTF